MAYALRAEAPNREVDYSSAVEFLGRSLQAKPNSPEAVFNRALVYERIPMYEDAEREWRRYLDMDKGGAWREEAQRHLADIKQKKKSGR
jgi:tetratricopeptide (TPR) repeat protein